MISRPCRHGNSRPKSTGPMPIRLIKMFVSDFYGQSLSILRGSSHGLSGITGSITHCYSKHGSVDIISWAKMLRYIKNYIRLQAPVRVSERPLHKTWRLTAVGWRYVTAMNQDCNSLKRSVQKQD